MLVGIAVIGPDRTSAPGTFQLLKIRVMHDQIDLIGEFLINFCQEHFNGLDNVVRNQGRLLQGLRCKRFYSGLHRFLGTVGFGFEFLLKRLLKSTYPPWFRLPLFGQQPPSFLLP